jgi:inorganic pyrophosphatase
MPSNNKSVLVFVEIPKGSRNKYEYDPELGRIKYDRMLFSSVHYPSDYGFILDTLAEDGDPLDAMVLITEPTFPGCIIEVKPVGLFKMWDEKGPDEKILGVPLYDPLWNFIEKLEDVPPHLLLEIEHFFQVYKELEKKKTGVEGWENVDRAWEVIEEARKRYQEKLANNG